MQKGLIKESIAPEMIESAEFATLVDTMFGQETGIIDCYEKLTCTKITENLVRLGSGIFTFLGRAIVVMPETFEDFTITTCPAGYKKYCLIVAEYVKNGQTAGSDFLGIRLVDGVQTTSTPAVPSLVQDNIWAGGNRRQEEIYRIYISGSAIQAISLMAKIVLPWRQAVNTAKGSFDTLADRINSLVDIGGMQTITGVKTFNSSPAVPTPAAGGHAVNKSYVDTNTVSVAGSQTITGSKTFNTPPAVPTPTAAGHAASKSYVDAGNWTKTAVSGTNWKRARDPITGFAIWTWIGDLSFPAGGQAEAAVNLPAGIGGICGYSVTLGWPATHWNYYGLQGVGVGSQVNIRIRNNDSGGAAQVFKGSSIILYEG